MASIDINDLADYYTDLLIVQYNDKPRARATISSMVRTLLNSLVICDVRDGFNVDTAVGVQLDVIGKYVGIDRNISISFVNANGYLGLWDSEVPLDGNNFGLVDSSDFDTPTGDGAILDSELDFISTTRLDDDQYRFVIKLKIIQNNSNHSHKSIDGSIFSIFGNSLQPTSSNNMAMAYYVTSANLILAEISSIKGVLPKPMGVGLAGLILKEEDDKFFGFTFGMNPSISGNINGMTLGQSEFDTKVGKMLTKNDIISL